MSVESTPSTPGALHGVVAPVRVDPCGLTGPTRGQAAGKGWRRTSRGFYVPAGTEVSPQQRIVEAGVLVPEYAALTGWAALNWLGGWWFSGMRGDGVTPRPVPIASSRHRIRAQPGMTLCEERWDPADVIVVDGLRVTTPVRSTWFEMRYARHLGDAVKALDMAAFHDLVSIDEMWTFAHGHPSYTGIGQCRDAVWLADENTWSPMETEMRQVWEETGFPRPLTNRPVFDLHGNHIGTPDLIDPEAGVMGEYEGGVHRSGAQHLRDVVRSDRLHAHGLHGAVMVAEDRRDPSAFKARLRGAYARAAETASARRRWTTELPDWWCPTFTVSQRRALDATDRAVWLRYRAA